MANGTPRYQDARSANGCITGNLYIYYLLLGDCIMANAKSMIETVSGILNSCESRLSGMPDKSRIQIKDLTQAISSELNLNPKDALAFVTYFARNTDMGYVSRGKNGGLIKGTRPAKSAPTPPSSSNDDSVDSDSDSDSDSDE